MPQAYQPTTTLVNTLYNNAQDDAGGHRLRTTTPALTPVACPDFRYRRAKIAHVSISRPCVMRTRTSRPFFVSGKQLDKYQSCGG